MKLSVRSLAAITIALLFAACDSPTPVEPSASLRVLPQSPNLLIGSTIRLTPFDLSGTPLPDSAIKWSSSNAAVVTVDAIGRIAGVATGAATIRAIGADGFAEAVVTIVGPSGSIEAGPATACATAITGELYCWGANNEGQAAIGDTVSVVREPRKVPGNMSFSSVSLSIWHGCGMTTAGLHCWGRNHRGQLGLGAIGPTRREPTRVVGNTAFVAVAVASTSIDENAPFLCLEFGCSSYTCAITADGTLYCWGNGVVAPAALGITNRFGSLEAGVGYTCGIDFAHVPHCWGFARHNESTRSLIAGTQAPAVPGNYRFQSLSGSTHVCGLDFDGDVYCWGSNTSGQLGAPSGTEYCIPFLGVRDPCRAAPAKIETAYKFLTVSAGGSHTCGLATTLEVICWGSNRSGQLGTGMNTPTTQVPAPVTSAVRFRSVSAGGAFTCAVALDADVYCWGANPSGQLGNGSTASSLVPVRVSGGVKFK